MAVGNRRREHRGSMALPPVARGDVVADMPPVPRQFWGQAMADDDGPEVAGAVYVQSVDIGTPQNLPSLRARRT